MLEKPGAFSVTNYKFCSTKNSGVSGQIPLTG